MRYILTNLGEKLSDAEVDELLATAKVNSDGSIDYRQFVKEVGGNVRRAVSPRLVREAAAFLNQTAEVASPFNPGQIMAA